MSALPAEPDMTLQRFEVDIAADAVIALLVAGLLSGEADRIEAAAKAAGIPLFSLTAARQRRAKGEYVPPRWGSRAQFIGRIPPPTEPAEPRPFSDQPGNAEPGEKPPPVRDRQTDTERWCVGKAHRCWLPLDRFGIKNKRTGLRQALCRDCTSDYCRQRYLSVERGHQLAELIRFTTVEGDACVGKACPKCSAKIRAGEPVEGLTSLAHVACPVPVAELTGRGKSPRVAKATARPPRRDRDAPVVLQPHDKAS